RQGGVEQQRRHRELGTDRLDAAPFDGALTVILREHEASADIDGGIVEKLARLLPDLDDAAGVVGAVDGGLVVGGAVLRFVFRHAWMLAERFEIGVVVVPLDAEDVFAAATVEVLGIEVLAFDAAVIRLRAQRAGEEVAQMQEVKLTLAKAFDVRQRLWRRWLV